MFINKKFITILILYFSFHGFSLANENYFEEAKKKFLISFILYFTFFGFSYAKENYYNEAKKKI